MFAARLLTTDLVQATQIHPVALADVADEFHDGASRFLAQVLAKASVPWPTQLTEGSA